MRDKNYNQLIYTRRVGAQSALDGAVKFADASHGVEYGAFAASESDVTGRDFLAVRGLIPGKFFSAGYVLTKVNDPFGLSGLGVLPRHDLNALVQGADFKLRVGERNIFDALLIATERDTALGINWDFGGTATWGYTGKAWDFGSNLTHFGRDLNYNDFGYWRDLISTALISAARGGRKHHAQMVQWFPTALPILLMRMIGVTA